MLGRPGVGVTIDIDGADEDEAGDGGQAQDAQGFFTGSGVYIGGIESAEVVAEADDAEPGEDGIADDEADMRVREEGKLVEEGEADGGEAVAAGVDAIEEVVSEDENERKGQDGGAAEVDDGGEEDHGYAEGPDDLEDIEGEVEVEGPAYGD